MSLKKTGTVDLDDPDSWGSLVPLVNTQPLPTYNLAREETLVGRHSDCLICINDRRLSSKHCTILKQKDGIKITDLSTNGTFIASKKIGKGNTVELKHNDQIWLLTASKVPIAETIGFRIQIFAAIEEEKKKKEADQQQKNKERQQKQKKSEEEKQKLQEQKKKLQEEKAKTSAFSQSIKDQITCSFCYEIMCIPVSIQPCNHRFCGGCLTELVNSKKDTCIQCRKQITTAVRDASFNSIIQDYIKTHPDEKRDPAEEEDQKKKNIFGFDPINVHEKIHGKVAAKQKVDKPAPTPARRGRGRGRVARVQSDLSASDDDDREKCRECIVTRNGFRCSASQVHVGCHTCGKLIAQRDDPTLFQCCTLCTTYFCNIYYPPCKAGVKLNKLQSCRQKCKIDQQLLRGNKFEFQAIRNFLLLKKRNSRDVFDHMMKNIEAGKFSYLMDKKIMKVAPLVSKTIKLDKNTAVCDQCWNDLWFQMVIAYRIEIAPELPSNVRDRAICYWGINCRTMDHNTDHAKKYNHCVYQSRF